ncbi:putative formate dehydrogenase protein [Phaeoacremonium minimum UCRPA7]|uniref:Putative formate dehydrogenase protein n=1 Tax=Phaeoacremonium minimum (strain UCR-PA7) TaxID=1286976 RepID=R8BLK2_PHAM7|nr:putative formate dehydrogenase protein [Phaeoacremonium minimum UCRPA7]EOO00256.1 putative formate dehydrogenase protein [Phaeoacremonium minimum UCRPA7]
MKVLWGMLVRSFSFWSIAANRDDEYQYGTWRDDAQAVEGGGGSRPSSIQSTVLTPDKPKQPAQGAGSKPKEPSNDDDFFASDALQNASPKPAFSDNVAVIMETDPSNVPNLIPLMLHFESILGPKWPVVLLTLEANWKVPSSPSFRRLMDAGRIRIMYLEANTTFPNHNSVSVFLTSPWFWEQFESAHRMLMFQTDSILCSNSDLSVDDFLEFDLLGAPIAAQFGHGYNGGLSLRNPKLMLQVARAAHSSFGSEGGGNEVGFEDQWFYGKLKALPEANLPSEDVAKTFAVETIYYEKPLGYHQPERWQHDHMEQIKEWCPEVGMLMGRRF